MIKSLKRRFIIIYMVILSCFLITILCGIYLIVYHSETSQSQEIMELALLNNTNNGERMSSPPKKIIDFSTNNVIINSANENINQENIDFQDFDFEDDEVLQDDNQNNEFPNLNPVQWDSFYYNNDFVLDKERERENEKENERNNGFNNPPLEGDYPNIDNNNNPLDDYPNDLDDWEDLDDWKDRLPPNNFQPYNPEDFTTTISIETPLTSHYIESSDNPIEPTEPVMPSMSYVNIEEPSQDAVSQQDAPSTEPEIAVTIDDTSSDITTETTLNTTETTSSTIETTTTIDTTITTNNTEITSSSSIDAESITGNFIKKIIPKDDFKNELKEKPIIEYEGNLARNTIYVSTDKDGEIKTISYQYFESSDNISLEQTVSSIISSGVMSGKVDINEIKFRYNVFKKEDGNGYDIVFLDRAIELSTLNRLLMIFIGIGAFGLIILFGVSWILASWAVTPIAEAWDKQKQFIADASHELKTPLTVIATNTDVILSNEDDTVRNQSKWLTYIKSETIRMSKLVSDLLYIAKSDVNEVSMIMSEFNISHTVSGICLVFETVAFENGKILDYDIEDDISYSGDEDRIKQLVNILVDNAIKHSDVDAEINVTLKRDIKDKIKLTITNTKGEEIPTGMEDRLFERFFRVDKSRNHNNGSHGLGLNIAQSIVRNHNGTISASSTVDHVVTFTVIL